MSFWTDEKVEELKRLAPDHSASQIAGILGAPTRNMVVGKLRRIRVALRPERPRGLARPRIPRLPALKWSPPPMPRQALPEVACEPVPETAVGIADLTPNACRYPLWGETEPAAEGKYCGGRAIKGAPYCGHHCRIAYQVRG